MIKSIHACATLILVTLLTLPIVPVFAATDGAATEPDNSNFAMVMSGLRLYQQYCAACHGRQAEGGSTGVGSSGSIPPGLNGSAHTWHHSTRDLIQLISFGTVSRGGTMPAWGGTLSKQQMLEIISWFQSRWPDEKYQEWLTR